LDLKSMSRDSNQCGVGTRWKRGCRTGAITLIEVLSS